MEAIQLSQRRSGDKAKALQVRGHRPRLQREFQVIRATKHVRAPTADGARRERRGAHASRVWPSASRRRCGWRSRMARRLAGRWAARIPARRRDGHARRVWSPGGAGSPGCYDRARPLVAGRSAHAPGHKKARSLEQPGFRRTIICSP